MSDQIDNIQIGNIRAIAHRQALKTVTALKAVAVTPGDLEDLTELLWEIDPEFDNNPSGWNPDLASRKIPFLVSGPTSDLFARAGALAEWESNNASNLNADGWAALALAWKRLGDECADEYRDRVALVAEHGESL